jgi:hypothetical protein
VGGMVVWRKPLSLPKTRLPLPFAGGMRSVCATPFLSRARMSTPLKKI